MLPIFSQRLAKIGLSPRIKMLSDRLGHGQERTVHTWNCRAPIEISAHSSSSKDSGALMTMLARKRRINSSISNGSFNLSHRVDKEKIKLLTGLALDVCAVRIWWLVISKCFSRINWTKFYYKGYGNGTRNLSIICNLSTIICNPPGGFLRGVTWNCRYENYWQVIVNHANEKFPNLLANVRLMVKNKKIF